MKNSYTKNTEDLLKIFYSDQYGIEEKELKESLEKISRYYDKYTRHQLGGTLDEVRKKYLL